MGFIEFNDKNGDGVMFYLGDECNEMKVDWDIMVLVNLEIVNLFVWVIVLVVVGGVVVVLFILVGLLLVIFMLVFYDLLK